VTADVAENVTDHARMAPDADPGIDLSREYAMALDAG
jgi:hypothetical protein